MLRSELIKALKEYFDIKELVCPHTYEKYGEDSWKFLDTMALHCLLVIRRDILKVPLVCNTKTATQRGLRCNLCDLIKNHKGHYLTMHGFGKAFDLVSARMSAQEMRERIKEQSYLLPCSIRMERGVSWLHFDVMPLEDGKYRVYEFTA